MTVAGRQDAFGVGDAFGARRGWFALAVRLLAVWLALVTALPQAGFAADLHHHLGEAHPGDRHSVLIAAPDSVAVSQAADPGLATHLHCGCHSLAPASAAEPILADPRPRPRYSLAVLHHPRPAPPASARLRWIPVPPRAGPPPLILFPWIGPGSRR